MMSLLLSALCGAVWAQNDVETRVQYLSGHGCDDTVEWQFKCTDGRKAGEWTTIGVPSCWELQGFGTYQYGMRFYGKATPEGIADEQGLYKYEFTLPQSWQGRQILLTFEAVMTDAEVTINGRKAGRGLHQGGFTRFQFDVSDRIFFGPKKKNRLEVTVKKESANSQVNMAERRADYWNFGGIWRPVYIVAKPVQNIQRVAIDARADGQFKADVYLNRALPQGSVSVDIVDSQNKRLASKTFDHKGGDLMRVDFSAGKPRLWTAETPHLYTAVFTLKDAQGKTLHVERQRFGFRTIEYRHRYAGDADDGLFVNGKKVIIKGVNRHSFRPETGRTLSKAKNIEDVELIKSMNMNAVRLSHYPADPEFLDACDSLGLYVECELPGWHWAHETINGAQLVEEMVTRDVNHPSILFWSNGNEGGFNYDLEPFFAKFDPQQRVVLYPWANRNGFETKHYRSWGETAEYMRQKEIFMPTEFLHGLYDGGHGAGLKDYWKLMMSNPRCAGGFLWDLMDQGVVRTDWAPTPNPSRKEGSPENAIVDCMGNFGADGIVGPHMEKEGSFYTIKEIWSPVELNIRDDQIVLHNHYDFTNLSDCRFSYRLLDMPAMGDNKVSVVGQGTLRVPSVEPGKTATLSLPESLAEVVEISATDPHGRDIFTWSFPNPQVDIVDSIGAYQEPGHTENDAQLTVMSQGKTYVFSKQDGRLTQVKTARGQLSLQGPRLVAAKRADRSQDGFYNHDDKQAFDKKTQYTEYADQGQFDHFEWQDGELIAHYRHGSIDQVAWTFWPDGRVSVSVSYAFNGVVDLLGISFDYPEQQVRSKQWVGRGPYRVWQNRLEGPQYGYWTTDYNDPIPGESWEYPEFKGYFSEVSWMQLQTTEGRIGITDIDEHHYVGIYQPRDGRDHILFDLPQTGISILKAIPAVRNKVNTTDLNGPSAQPYWSKGRDMIGATFVFD